MRWVKRILLLAVGAFFAVQLWFLGHVVFWKFFNPGETAFMALRLEDLREKNPKAQLKQRWVPYARISVHLKRAVIAAEDDGFVDHDGFDWEGMQRALEKNQKKGKVVAGGSTISQQLAKNLFLSPSKSYVRKAQEAVITLMLEAVLGKQRILEIYLNVVEWGNGVFGAEAAAQRYYGLSAAKLGPSQAAHLAVMLPNPRKYETRFGPRQQAHADRVLARMSNSDVP